LIVGAVSKPQTPGRVVGTNSVFKNIRRPLTSPIAELPP
jgi:hypothetical protein